MYKTCVVVAAGLLLAAPAFAQTRNSRTGVISPAQRSQIIAPGQSTGAAVRDQSFIGSGGRRGDSQWVTGSALRTPGGYYGGGDPVEAGQVGQTGN